MAKAHVPIFNIPKSDKWEKVPDTDDKIEFITLATDEERGDYTRITRFLPGANSEKHGVQSHDYVEEIYVLEGELYDVTQDVTLVTGDYTSRAVHEKHGPFSTEKGCLILEISFPEPADKI